ncbi:MAG: hypothetical protein BGO55_00710 [Sphingobacteriales bacterium 50-39]|nr:hypothetical protein [Sphingobacteriales bacterium]OJW53636.1 MAG: hypothetical protein BGO55_00710 [Sphingobacteriales bacterium 50-39]
MTPDYLLGLLVKSNRAFLKAQREYAACQGDPKRDLLKQSHQQEVRRRREDLVRLLAVIQRIFPVPDD